MKVKMRMRIHIKVNNYKLKKAQERKNVAMKRLGHSHGGVEAQNGAVKGLYAIGHRFATL